jgi:hypothetical protein
MNLPDKQNMVGVRFDCPFDSRLARTPYLVLPKLAIQAMPFDWRDRFDALLAEMEATGLETPEYVVLRDDGPDGEYTKARVVNRETGFVRVRRAPDDPWANYKYGIVEELCPNFERLTEPQSYHNRNGETKNEPTR